MSRATDWLAQRRDLVISARIPRALRYAVEQAAQRRAGPGRRATLNGAVNVALVEYIAASPAAPESPPEPEDGPVYVETDYPGPYGNPIPPY